MRVFHIDRLRILCPKLTPKTRLNLPLTPHSGISSVAPTSSSTSSLTAGRSFSTGGGAGTSILAGVITCIGVGSGTSIGPADADDLGDATSSGSEGTGGGAEPPAPAVGGNLKSLFIVPVRLRLFRSFSVSVSTSSAPSSSYTAWLVGGAGAVTGDESWRFGEGCGAFAADEAGGSAGSSAVGGNACMRARVSALEGLIGPSEMTRAMGGMEARLLMGEREVGGVLGVPLGSEPWRVGDWDNEIWDMD